MIPKFNNLPSSDFDDFILENSLEIFDDRFLIVETAFFTFEFNYAGLFVNSPCFDLIGLSVGWWYQRN